MNRIKHVSGIFAFALLVLSLATLASAQWNRNNGNYNASQLKSAVQRLESDSRDFAKFVDRDLDRSKYDGRRSEDNLNQLAANFRDAVNRLNNRIGNGRNLDNSSSEAENV